MDDCSTSSRDGNNDCCEVTGEKVNHGSGVGLEFCASIIFVARSFCQKLSSIVNKLIGKILVKFKLCVQ